MGVVFLITSCSCGRHMSFSSSTGAAIVWRKCSCRVAQSWELRNLSKAVAQAELRNPTGCASRVAQSWKLRKRRCEILEVEQAKFRNPSCAIRPKRLRNPSCAIRRSCGIGLYSHKITLHYITLHGVALHYITFTFVTLHRITSQCISLHYITVHCIAYITIHCTTLQHVILHCIHTCMHAYFRIHCIALCCSTLHCITLHYITFNLAWFQFPCVFHCGAFMHL